MFSSQPQKSGQKIRLILSSELRKRDRNGTGVGKEHPDFPDPWWHWQGRDDVGCLRYVTMHAKPCDAARLYEF